MSITNNKFTFNWVMVIPILGWIYIIAGLVFPFQHWLWITIWWIDVFLSIVVHSAQIIVSLPIAIKQGFTKGQTIFYTFIFGATWWKPLQDHYKRVQP